MGSINMGSVIKGGLLTGLIINVGETILNGFLLKDDWAAVMKSFNKPDFNQNQIAMFVALGFVQGILALWLYAGIRPRLGAGMQTALIAGGFMALTTAILPTLGYMVTGLFPSNLMMIAMAWSTVEILIATVVGAKIYSEAAAPNAASASAGK